jgi:hypothetical protein
MAPCAVSQRDVGALILIAPRLLNYIVVIYLIVIGPIGLFGTGTIHLR